MRCPACGQFSAEEVAPGWWECTARITYEVMVLPPGYANPVGERRVRVCGQRFQTAPPADGLGLRCSCGTFAVGECARCLRPVCGDDSARLDGQRLCSDCAAAARAVAAEQKRQAGEAAKRDEQAAFVARIEQAQAVTARLPDLARRAVAAGGPRYGKTRPLLVKGEKRPFGPRGWEIGVWLPLSGRNREEDPSEYLVLADDGTLYAAGLSGYGNNGFPSDSVSRMFGGSIGVFLVAGELVPYLERRLAARTPSDEIHEPTGGLDYVQRVEQALELIIAGKRPLRGEDSESQAQWRAEHPEAARPRRR